MGSVPRSRIRLRFGGFEVDLAKGELRKHGVRIPLQAQPFHILTILLERQGEVVPREELRERIWPSDTFVEFEHSLNTAINKLRRGLGDSADAPRFIETVPKRGYRFAGTVEPVVSEPKQAPRSTLPWIAVLAVSALSLAGALHFRQRVSGGAAPSKVVPITTFAGDERRPSFSPDGSQIAFTWGGPNNDNRDIYVMVVGNGQPLRITSDPAMDGAPAWSPDGQWISFVRWSPSVVKGDVYIVPALGGAERKIGETSTLSRPGSWPPPVTAWTADSKWIAVPQEARDGKPAGLYLIAVGAGENRLLIASPEHIIDRDPAFSWDGSKLAFSRQHSIYVVDLEQGIKPRGKPRRLTESSVPFDRAPAWTADQKEVIYARWEGNATTLWRVAVDGSTAASPISGTGTSAAEPALTRGGGRLAFVETHDQANIWQIPLRSPGQSAGPAEPLIVSSRLDAAAAYSPDGPRIVFFSNRSGSQRLWLASRDGSKPVLLNHPGTILIGTPKWSPDGRYIVYDAAVGSNTDIYVASPDNWQPRRLTDNPANDLIPSWSADGKWVYFSSDRSGVFEIWKKPFVGGEEIRVIPGEGKHAKESPDGKYLCYVSTDRGKLWLVPRRDGEFDPQRKKLVAEDVHYLVFEVVREGVYFYNLDRIRLGSASLRFYNFATGRTNVVADFRQSLYTGLSASYDGRWLMFSKFEKTGSDLMLYEGFR
ncbi:MAG: PD40 domain-containing protein [Bryobacterales bacterium]|nr:PD40 domain-containing protein [Bryobacterales bacterium]